MNETVNTILTTVVIPLAGVLTTYIVSLLRKKSKEVSDNINNVKVTKYVNIAEDAICTAVTAVSQTYVDELKKKGTFDQAAKDEAFVLAKQKALSIMGEGAQLTLKELYTDFNTWLDSKIEYYVNAGKTVKSTVNNTIYQVPQSNNPAPDAAKTPEADAKSICAEKMVADPIETQCTPCINASMPFNSVPESCCPESTGQACNAVT